MRFASRVLCSFLLVALAALAYAISSHAQTPPTDLSTATNTGTNPYETYGGERENISFGTGNLNVPLTLLSLPGRNGHDLVVQIAFDSRVWQLHGSFDQNSDTYVVDWEKDGGWSHLLPTLFTDSIPITGAVCTGSYMLYLPDGSKQSFPTVRNQCVSNTTHLPAPGFDNLVGDSAGLGYSRLSVTHDGSGGVSVVLKDGSQLMSE